MRCRGLGEIKCGLLVLGLIFGMATSVGAQEVDSFTDRLFLIDRLRDGTDEADRFVNDRIAEVVRRLNNLPRPRKRNDEEQVIESVFQSPIAPELFSPIEDWVKLKSGIQRYRLSGRGIYGGAVDYDDMFMAWYIGLSPTIRLASTFIGTDKISHVFGQGWQYYQWDKDLAGKRPTLSRAERHDLVRKFGHELEEAHLGLTNDGVYSYADMAANWQGFRFYLNLIGTSREAHILRAEGGRYASGAPFTFRDYVVDEFDEVLNPNRLRTERFYRKVALNFHQPSPSGHRSVCAEYMSGRTGYLNRTGRSLRREEYVWSGDPGASPRAPLVLRIEEICQGQL